MLGTTTTTVGVTGATGPATGASGAVTGTTGAAQPQSPAQPATELQGQATNSAPGARINAMMLYYAVSVYAYRAAYLETIKNIQESADGHGVFKVLPANLLGDFALVGVDGGELKKGKTIASSEATKENDEAIIEDSKDPEVLKAAAKQLGLPSMTQEEFLASYDIELPRPEASTNP